MNADYQTYRAELEAVREGVYARLPGGMEILAARRSQRSETVAPPVAASKRNTLPSMSAAEAVIAAYCEARAASVSGHQPKRQASATQANMIAQLERAGLKPVARR